MDNHDGDASDPPALASFGTELNAAVIGASGGIGGALAGALESCRSVSTVHRLSRSNPHADVGKDSWLRLDIENEDSVADAAASIKKATGSLHLVIVASGVLHNGTQLQPEKSLRALTGTAMETAFLG